MSRNVARRGASSSKGTWKDRIHTVFFSYQEEDEIKEWFTRSNVTWHVCLSELIDDGYSVKVSPPASGDDYWVSVTLKKDMGTWTGHTFSIRYPDFEQSVIIMYWFCKCYLVEGRYQMNGDTTSRSFLD